MEDSSWGRLAGVLLSPVKTFESISARPTWVVALIVLMVVSLIFTLAAIPKIDMAAAIQKQMERQDRQISAEQMERITQMAEKMKWISPITGLMTQAAVYFLLALIFWVLFRLIGDEFSYMHSVAVTTHAFIPQLLSAVLTLPIVFKATALDPEKLRSGLLASNLGFLAGQGTSPFLRSVLSSLDIFSLWTVMLLVVGYSIVAKMRRSTAATVTCGLWLLYILGKAGLTAAFAG
jgi:uncharacterized membrane protein YfhO